MSFDASVSADRVNPLYEHATAQVVTPVLMLMTHKHENTSDNLWRQFLADGRVYATVLRLSSVRNVLWLNGAS